MAKQGMKRPESKDTGKEKKKKFPPAVPEIQGKAKQSKSSADKGRDSNLVPPNKSEKYSRQG